MEIFKINNINDFVKEERSNASEVLALKGSIENYIANFFAPNLKLRLDMNLNLVNDGTYQAIYFDQMAFLRPLASMMDVNISTVKPEEISSYLTVRLQSKLNELKSITKEEELIVKFPTISGIYQTKKDHITKSVSLEQDCKIIKPSNQAEFVKAKKLGEFGISRNEHASNLIEAYTFSLQSFLYAYAGDLERVITYLDYLRTNISQAVMPTSQMESLDQNKISTYIESMKQKTRGLN